MFKKTDIPMDYYNPREIFEEAMELERKGEILKAIKLFKKARNQFELKSFNNLNKFDWKKAEICNFNYLRLKKQFIHNEFDDLLKNLSVLLNESHKIDKNITLNFIRNLAYEIKKKENFRDQYIQSFPFLEANDELRKKFREMLQFPESSDNTNGFYDEFDEIHFLNQLHNLEVRNKKLRKEIPELAIKDAINNAKSGINSYIGLYEVEFKHLLSFFININSFKYNKKIMELGLSKKRVVKDYLFNKFVKNLPFYNFLIKIFQNKALLRHLTVHRNYKIKLNSFNQVLIIFNPKMENERYMTSLDLFDEIRHAKLKISLILSYLLTHYYKFTKDSTIYELEVIYSSQVTGLSTILYDEEYYIDRYMAFYSDL